MNIGCGQTPTAGWHNFDNSLSLRLARHPILTRLLAKVGLLDPPQLQNIQFCRANSIRWADATKNIPLPDDSVEILYSSHMLEHLDRLAVAEFLREARRVLAPGGILRIVVPDIRTHVEQYVRSRDANAFLEATHLTFDAPRTIKQRALLVVAGPRHHLWMYDRESLLETLLSHGFTTAECLEPGQTSIEDPGPLNLCERSNESIYVEARNPAVPHGPS